MTMNSLLPHVLNAGPKSKLRLAPTPRPLTLTQTMIDRVEYEGRNNERHVIWDQKHLGLGLRIYPSGRKVFIFLYRHLGKKKLITLGAVGHLSLLEARTKASQAYLGLTKGDDPLTEKRSSSADICFQDFCEIYMTNHALPHKKSHRDDRRRIDLHLAPRWKNRGLKAISKTDVANLHIALGREARYEANRTLALVSGIFGRAKSWGYLDNNAANPAYGIKKFKEVKRDRWAGADELPRLLDTIDRYPNPYIKQALWLYLLTGVRKQELLTLKWENVDLGAKEILLTHTKSGRAHRVPLSDQAVERITSLPKLEGNPYLFPGSIHGKHLVNIEKPWQQIRGAAGVPDLRLHDLRRTAGSWMASNGVQMQVIGSILNHSSIATTQVYARLGQGTERLALEHLSLLISQAHVKSKNKGGH